MVKGTYQGRQVWIGVQEFGLPLSACASPEVSLKNQIDTDKTQERTVEALQICGWQGDDLSEFSDNGLHGLDTNEVSIVVELESYVNADGEEKSAPRVKWINRIGGQVNVQSAMDPTKAAAFGSRMKGLVHAMRAKAPVADTGTAFNFGANAPAQAAPKRAF